MGWLPVSPLAQPPMMAENRPGASTGVHEQDAAGPEHRHGRVPERLGHALGDAAGALHDLGARELQAGVAAPPATRSRLQPASANTRAWSGPTTRMASKPSGSFGWCTPRRPRASDAHSSSGVRALWSTTQRGPSPGKTVTALVPGAMPRHSASGVPRRAFLVLGEAEADLAGVAVGGPVDATGTAAADVADDELQGPADGGVGPVALAEHVHAAVHADGPADRAVDDQHRPDRHRGGQHAVDVELVVAGRLDGGQHDRQVLGPAAGHHGVDGDLLDGDVDEVGRHDGHDLVGRAGRALQHPQDALLGGRHHRQAVGPAPVEQRLHLVLGVGDLDAAAVQQRTAEPDPQLVDEVRVDRHRAAARAGRPGRSAPRSSSPVKACHDVAVPADGALGLDAVDDAEQRGHGLDVVVPRRRTGRRRGSGRRRAGTTGRPGCRR